MFLFRKYLKETREAMKLSVEAAAEKVGVSAITYSDYENGRQRLNVPARVGILVGLGITHDEAFRVAREIEGGSFGELMELENRGKIEQDDPFVYLEEGTIFLVPRSNSGPYTILASRITNPEMVVRWVNHLSEKNWVTTKHLRDFVSICAEILEFSLHPVG